jgi:hypothetical protein
MSELLNTDTLRETAEEYHKNFEWFMKNQELVKSKFRGKFIAIHHTRIFASDEYKNLLKVLKAAGVTKADSVFKTYIPETDDVLMMM